MHKQIFPTLLEFGLTKKADCQLSLRSHQKNRARVCVQQCTGRMCNCYEKSNGSGIIVASSL